MSGPSLKIPIFLFLLAASSSAVPIVINTWPWPQATEGAWRQLDAGSSALDAVEAGCNIAEHDLTIPTVGYGGSPDERGNTTLDALIMDGESHQAGAVASMPRIKDAIKVARAVMQFTNHTLLVGPEATRFAVEMGFREEILETPQSIQQWKEWVRDKCQPNYRRNVDPDPRTSCGPYTPVGSSIASPERRPGLISQWNHDTIGMIAMDASARLAVGTSTNGAAHRIPGRVGDTAVIGSGGYVDGTVGGAAGTGDGDILMRYLVAFQAVAEMEKGANPQEACRTALNRIKTPSQFSGALVALNKKGEYGGACRGFDRFQFCVRSGTMNSTQVIDVPCDP